MPSARWSRCDPTSSVGRSWQREPHHLASGQTRRDGQRRGRDRRPGELRRPRAPARRVPARDRRGDPARARACDAGPSPCGAPIPVRPGARGDAKAASRLRRAGARARARALDLQRVPSPRARAAGAARHCRPPPAQALRRRAGRRGGPRPRADRGARLGARSARAAATGIPSRPRADHRRAGAGHRRPGGNRVLTIEETAARAERVLAEIERAVVGKRDALELVLLGFLADGHVLIEDFPGLAKTLIARSFAQVCDMRFARIQFTPDLMPSDVTGSSVYNQRTGDFEFRPGPIFTNLLLGDEINRAPPKTQAALLEAMQERQVTIEGMTHPLGPPFLVIATQNPIEYEGTYPLPEAQLDRFLVRVGVGYPGRDDEWQMLERRIEREEDEIRLDPVTDRNGVLELQRAIEQVHVSEAIGYYVVDLVASTRATSRVQVGSSPRGTLAVMKLARAHAALRGRDFLTPEDVKAVAVSALAHRLMLRPELWAQRVRPEDIVRELLDTVPTPAAEDVAGRG